MLQPHSRHEAGNGSGVQSPIGARCVKLGYRMLGVYERYSTRDIHQGAVNSQTRLAANSCYSPPIIRPFRCSTATSDSFRVAQTR